MTDPHTNEPRRGALAWIRRILRLERPSRLHRPERDIDREKVRVQIDVIRRAFDDQVAIATGNDHDDAEFLYRPEHVLVRREEREELDSFFEERQEDYRGIGEVMAEPVEGLNLYRLPPRRADGGVEVLRTLDELDREKREGFATPDHVLYVTPRGLGGACPATEPEVPSGTRPVPAVSKDPKAGAGVRVSVVDTGWHPPAAGDPDTPWLVGVDGDLEQINPSALHEYAGHGTFVAGVVRCLAPAVEIEVEGFLTKGGAIYESEITAQLNEAMTDKDNPDLISISAGTRTRNNIGLIGFQTLSVLNKFEGDDAVLVIAAAGNDGSNVPFWPAAFDWVVSVGALDANGRLSDFSNYGPWVDVYAHGRNLVNAFPTGTYTTYEPQTPAGHVRTFTTGLAQWSGTSFSTPIVTGAIAAYMSQHGVSAHAARDALFASAATKQDPTAGNIKAMGPPFV